MKPMSLKHYYQRYYAVTVTEGPKLDLGMPGRPSAPSEGGNMMAMMAEIKDAYSKLSTEDKGILYLKHANSLDYGSIANELQLSSDDAARMRHKRAIKKIINRLGGYRPFLDKDEPDNKREDDSKEEQGNAKEDEATEQG
jgi:DNA-directed RNA polymerase specialized sigma24 family protein